MKWNFFSKRRTSKPVAAPCPGTFTLELDRSTQIRTLLASLADWKIWQGDLHATLARRYMDKSVVPNACVIVEAGHYLKLTSWRQPPNPWSGGLLLCGRYPEHVLFAGENESLPVKHWERFISKLLKRQYLGKLELFVELGRLQEEGQRNRPFDLARQEEVTLYLRGGWNYTCTCEIHIIPNRGGSLEKPAIQQLLSVFGATKTIKLR